MSEETWKDGGEYPNRYDRVCRDCGTKIPNGGRDYFYRRTAGGDYESLCRACMNKIPAAPPEAKTDETTDALYRIAEALEKIAKIIDMQGAK